MDILFSIATGLGLRFICLNLTEPLTRLSPVIIGVWEGAISHLVLSQDPELRQLSFDQFLAYGLRLVFDLILTQDPARPLAVVLWTGVSLWLCQFIDQQSIPLSPQQSNRRKRSRRHRVPATSSLPSHVRVYQTPQPPSDPLPHAATPPHEQPSTPPSFFLQGEGSEAIHLSPAPDHPSSALVDPPRPPSALAPQLEADDGKAQDKPAPFPTPPATFASPEMDKDLTGSARRLSTIVEASSVEDVPIMAMANLGAADGGAQGTLPERKEQDQNANGVRTTTRTDTVPLPVPDPFSRQLRSRASAQVSIAADSESATLISVKPAIAHKFLLRPYPEEEVLSDELQTPLNPVARALLEDDVDNVFTDNELDDELRTPLKFTRQLGDGPLSPLSPLLSVQVRLSDVQAGSSHKPPSGTQIAGTTDATDATLLRNSLLISSEADELDSLESDAESSMLSTAVPTELYIHGDDWRKKAWEEEKKYHELKKQYDKALKELRVKDALMLKGQIAESDATIKKLHEKAARRYYKARNEPGQAFVDVHGLRVNEAVEMTEQALRKALSSGHETLRVITGRGAHSKGKLPVLKYALLRAMEKQKIPCQPDPVNPGALIVTLPP
ncbi:hypothetical protein JOM56_002112 [Amanita muscaria]